MTSSVLGLALTAALAAHALFAQAPGRTKRTVSEAEVVRGHKSAPIIDTHNDVTSATVAGMDIGKPNPEQMSDVPRMKAGGMGAQFFAAYGPSASPAGRLLRGSMLRK